jgi:hypothetical protein
MFPLSPIKEDKMPAKQLTENQHLPLHNIWGIQGCCLCRSEAELSRLTRENAELKVEVERLKAEREKELREFYEGGIWWHINGGRWQFGDTDHGFSAFLASRKEK